jgi:hypothetical protein
LKSKIVISDCKSGLGDCAQSTHFFRPKRDITCLVAKHEEVKIDAKIPQEKQGTPAQEGVKEAVETVSKTCEPQGLTYDEFLKKTGNINDALGITRLAGKDVVMPQVVLDKKVLQKTEASMQISSFFLKPQEFKDNGIVILQEDGDPRNNYCPKGRYENHWLITQSGADKIKEGEQEHCNDFKLAFNLTLAKYRDAVNASAGKKFSSDKAVKKFIKKKTGVDPDSWAKVFWCLASKTKERDKMNWHLPKFIDARIDKSCKKAVVTLRAGNLPEIGKHQSNEIIKDCGEAGKP